MLDDPAAPRPPPPPPAPRPAVALRPCAYVGIIIIIIIGGGRRWFKMRDILKWKCVRVLGMICKTQIKMIHVSRHLHRTSSMMSILILPAFLITQSDNSAKYIRTPSYANITWWVRCVHKDTRPSVYSMISPKILVLWLVVFDERLIEPPNKLHILHPKNKNIY